ncbi:hypothetical protein Aperf_G00000079381 [Anoplocephala perfoliata]
MATTMLAPSSDLKIVVKFTKRLPIKPKDNLLARNLISVYNENDANKNHSDKRFTTKLIATRNDLNLTKGSWWVTGPTVSSLSFKNILQFSAIPGRPAKLMLLIKNDDGTKTELVVLKTKGQLYANQLLFCLQKNVNAVQQRMVQSSNGENNRTSRPVSYQMEMVSPQTPSQKTSTNSTLQKRRPAPSPPVELNRGSQKQKLLDKAITPRRVEGLQTSGRGGNSKISANGTTGNLEENYSRTTYDPETKVETLDSVVVYGQKSEKPPRPSNTNTKSRKSKSKAPRELSSLGGGRQVSREYDENNTPWEVNICYIKHDPLVGCVEDESGPIYMYTAHQLVSQDGREYDDYDSDDNEGGSFSGDSDSEDSSSTDSQDNMDENKELERFMMLGGSKNVTANGTSGTNGKTGEVYEY